MLRSARSWSMRGTEARSDRSGSRLVKVVPPERPPGASAGAMRIVTRVRAPEPPSGRYAGRPDERLAFGLYLPVDHCSQVATVGI